MWNSFRPGATFIGMSPIEVESDQRHVLSERIFTISDAVRSTRTGDGGVLLDLRHGRILTLNAVGSDIFELLQQGYDQSQIVDTVSRRFGVPIQNVQADVLAFVQTLQRCDILRTIRSNGAL